MFFNYLPLTNGQMLAPKPRRYCANVKLSSVLFWFLFFNLVNARPVLSVLVPPIDFVFVCADLRLLCWSSSGGVSPVSLFSVFVVIVDGFWFRFVNVRQVLSLFWIVCYFCQWSSYLQPSKLLLCGGDQQLSVLTCDHQFSVLTFHLTSMLFPILPILWSILKLSSILPTEARSVAESGHRRVYGFAEKCQMQLWTRVIRHRDRDSGRW